jgi:putative transposase
MSYIDIDIHAVWSTKFRQPVLTKGKREVLFKHMRENSREKKIYVDMINGYDDHVHCLLSLDAGQSIGEVIQLIKGESSFWANKQGLFLPELQWQRQYYAASVDKKSIQTVRNYILNQEEHHRVKTFDEEYKNYLIACGANVVPDYR